MDIQVGDRVTYKNKFELVDEIITIIVLNESDIKNFKNGFREILKIERPKYEVVEEKKELLTEEEREFLKQYIKMSPYNIKYIKKRFNESESITIILNDEQGTGVCTYHTTDYFKVLEEDKNYTLEELGLEEK